MNLSDAITAVETISASYSAAQQTTVNDQSMADAAQAKADAAKSQVATDQTAQSDAAGKYNSALDDLIAAAMAAKVPSAPAA